MGAHSNIPIQSAWLNGSMIVAPGALYGREYFVDKVSGNAANDGLSWASAKSTIASAISASNTYIAVTENANKRNRIFVGGGTYLETLTVFPNQCDLIGVGGRGGGTPIILYITTIGTACPGCRVYNMGFYQDTAASPTVTIPSGSHGIQFHGCEFHSMASVTYGLHITNCGQVVIEGCTFRGNPVYPTAIYLAGPLMYAGKILHNFISASACGIYFHTNCTSDYQTLVAWNVIGRWDPNIGLTELTTGINCTTDSADNAAIIGNWISAATPFSAGGSAGNKGENQCVGNLVTAGQQGAWLDAIA